MRIKISASTDDLPSCNFWYVVNDKTSQHKTIRDLQKNINTMFPLAKKAKHLTLSLDGFLLLPTSPINDLIRDGDTIGVQLHSSKREQKSTSLVPTPLLKSVSSLKQKQDKVKKQGNTNNNKKISNTSKISKTNKIDKASKISKTSKIDKASKISKTNKTDKASKINKPKKSTTAEQKRKEEAKPKSGKRKNEEQQQQPTIDTDKKRQKKTETAEKDNHPSKSKARNARRTKIRELRRQNKNATEQQQDSENSNNDIVSTTKTGDDHTHGTISSNNNNKDHLEPPRQLLKKNKNKKKNFMKQMDSKPSAQHIVFDDDRDTTTLDKQTDEAAQYDETMQGHQYDGDYDGDEYNNQSLHDVSNTHGGAFITESESQHVRRNKNYKQQNYMNRNYPVDGLDPLFFAIEEQQNENVEMDDNTSDTSDSDSSSSDSDSDSDSSSDDSSDSSTNSDDEMEKEGKVEHEKPAIVDEPQLVEKVDYETYPAITFQGPQSPVVGDHLAIKILRLSETYTPEISDWMEIMVVELTDDEMVVEHIGQLEIKSGRLRKFDLPPEHGLQQDDDNDDTKELFNYSDVFEMRRIVK